VALGSFYLYFPEERDARSAGARLEAAGYAVEVRPGADDGDWLALAERDLADDESLDEVEEVLERLAAELGGEYDGHEVDVT
jgi:hypothetical protein